MNIILWVVLIVLTITLMLWRKRIKNLEQELIQLQKNCCYSNLQWAKQEQLIKKRKIVGDSKIPIKVVDAPDISISQKG